MTYQQWLADAAQALNQINPTENGKVDALVLLQHANRQIENANFGFR